MYRIAQKGWSRANRFTTGAIVLLYLLATAHMSIALARLIQGFITYRNVIDPIDYFSDTTLTYIVAKDYFYITNLIVGDCVVVWRLYIVWGKNIWIAAFPIIMIIGTAISGYGSVSQDLLGTVSYEVAVNWVTAMFIISLCTNVIVTILTAARIWYFMPRYKEVMAQTPASYHRVILIIIESGCIIAAAKIVEFALFEVAPGSGIGGNNAMYIPYECMPQITGLMPTIIVLATNSGYTQRNEYSTSRSTASRAMTFAHDEVSTTTGISTSAIELEQEKSNTTRSSDFSHHLRTDNVDGPLGDYESDIF